MKRSAIFMSLLLAACANPLNLYTANRYFEGGRGQAAQGDWSKARMAFGRAWTNADSGNADDRVTATYAYEYGRASGVICDWAESEHGLLKALEIDRRSNGPVYMSLVELARMYHARGSLELSARYFGTAKEALDSVNADMKDPIGYATILEEYAGVLSSLGRMRDASLVAGRAQELEQRYRGRASGHVPTPYGQHCEQNPATRSAHGGTARTS
ncbi:MAG: hypothetical protein GC151_12040 [Betaproteobacteria bacterium]|nr:hypothetical protein [Betaproteobacteria bacterium]